MPVTRSVEPAVVAAPAVAAVAAKPPAPPKQAATVNTAMRGFAGIPQQAAPEPSLSDRLSRAEPDAQFGGGEDLAAVAAHFNDETVAEAPPVKEKSSGIFARLAKRSPAQAAPPAVARTPASADAAMAGLGDATMDAGMDDSSLADAALDPALVEAAMAGLDGEALPSERPARKKSTRQASMCSIPFRWRALRSNWAPMKSLPQPSATASVAWRSSIYCER